MTQDAGFHGSVYHGFLPYLHVRCAAYLFEDQTISLYCFPFAVEPRGDYLCAVSIATDQLTNVLQISVFCGQLGGAGGEWGAVRSAHLSHVENEPVGALHRSSCTHAHEPQHVGTRKN